VFPKRLEPNSTFDFFNKAGNNAGFLLDDKQPLWAHKKKSQTTTNALTRIISSCCVRPGVVGVYIIQQIRLTLEPGI
jgi:hypothetical protein